MLWNLFSCVAQSDDPRWGRTYEYISSDLDTIRMTSYLFRSLKPFRMLTENQEPRYRKVERKAVGISLFLFLCVLHRLNDCEDKWIVSTDGTVPDKEAIQRTIEFQEQLFMSELYLW